MQYSLAGSFFCSAGEDYTATSTVITFGPDDAEMAVTIPLINDNVVEGQENFTVVLSLDSPPPNVELEQSEVLIIITDDDGEIFEHHMACEL